MRNPARLIAVSLAGLVLVGGAALGLAACSSGSGPGATSDQGNSTETNPDDYNVFVKHTPTGDLICVTYKYSASTLSCVEDAR